MKTKEKYELVNTLTGEVTKELYLKGNEEIQIKRIRTEKEKAIINNKDELKRLNARLGGFLRVMYVENELLFNRMGLDSSEVARVLYLATYMDYENRENGKEGLLVKRIKNNKLEPMTRKDLFEVMKLGNTPFKAFISTMKKAGLLREEEGLFYMNTDYFKKGEATRKETYTRLYIETTKKLYEGCTSRQHKQLGYILQLIPHCHYESNIICRNINSIYELKSLNVYKLEEICELLGISTNKGNEKKFEKSLLTFTIKLDGKEYEVFKRVTVTGTGNNSYYVINPLLHFRGKDIKEMKRIVALCSFEPISK